MAAEPPDREYPPSLDVAALIGLTLPASEDPFVAGWLATRLGEISNRLDSIVRAVPLNATIPPWARVGEAGALWTVRGYRALFPVYDAVGLPRSVRVRRIIAGEGPKTVPPAGYNTGGLVLANAAAVEVLRTGVADRPITIAEGEPAFLAWCVAQEGPGLPVFGIWNGAWDGRLAARIPRGATVRIATDHDTAGDKYAEQIARSLPGRTLLRWSGADADEVFLAGGARALADLPWESIAEGTEPVPEPAEETPGGIKRLRKLIEEISDAADNKGKRAILSSFYPDAGGIGEIGELLAADDPTAIGLLAALKTHLSYADAREFTSFLNKAVQAIRKEERAERVQAARAERAAQTSTQARAMREEVGVFYDGICRSYPEHGKRPRIVLGTNMRQIALDSLGALRGAGCELYAHAGNLVQIQRYGDPDKPIASFRNVPAEAFRAALNGSGCYVTQRRDHEGGLVEYEEIPPRWIPDILGELSPLPFPVIEGMSTIPIVRPDGKIHTAPGYDPVTRLYHVADPTCTPVLKVDPTLDDAEVAADYLLDVFRDFHWTHPEIGPGIVLSAILSIVGRHLIRGPVPMYAVSANTPGTGKTTLVDAITMIAYGKMLPRTSWPKEEDEQDKRVGSFAIDGIPLVLLDNLERPLGGQSLDQALTSEQIAVRVLGSSRITQVPMRIVWFATGNNLQIHGDLARRLIVAYLTADRERPELRDDFEYDLYQHIPANRDRILGAALTILQAWVRCGMPKQAPPLRSFESWSKYARDPAIWLGCGNAADAQQVVREEADEALDRLREFLAAWRAYYGTEGQKIREVVAEFNAPTGGSNDTAGQRDGRARLGSVLREVAGEKTGSRISSSFLGYYCRKYKERRMGGLAIYKVGGDDKHGSQWAVRDAD